MIVSLFGGQKSPTHQGGRSVRGVGALTLGGIHDWKVADHAKIGLGASYAFDFVPSGVTPEYGGSPGGAMVFVRLGLE